MIFDLSGDGSFTDEAALVMAVVGIAGLFIGGSRLTKKVKRIDHAVNNVDVPITDAKVATLGQRVVRLESVSDEMSKSLRVLGENVLEQTRQTNHRHERMETKLDNLKEVLDVRQASNRA